MQESVETAGEFVVARGDATELLEPIEETFNQMARLVAMPVDWALIDSVAARRDIGNGVGGFDGFDQLIAVVAFVGGNGSGWNASNQRGTLGHIGDLSAGEQEGDGAAVAIGQRVDFGGAAAARTTDGLFSLPPFPPEAERCAFTAEESISTWAGGPPALASAWKRSTQTPFAAQRT